LAIITNDSHNEYLPIKYAEFMNIPVIVYKAFVSDKGRGGNPAGIIFSESPCSQIVMQSAARESGFPETVFITPLEGSRYRLRFFTPRQEVPLCGHATIAAWTWLSHEKKLTPGCYTQDTERGPLAIEITEEGEIFMEQPLPFFGAVADEEKVVASLGFLREALHPAYPVQLVSTGLPDILVPLSDISLLDKIKPDFKKIEDFCRADNDHDLYIVPCLANSSFLKRYIDDLENL